MNKVLSPEKRKEFDILYKSGPKTECPICKSSEHVIPHIQGKPSPDLILYANEGKCSTELL